MNTKNKFTRFLGLLLCICMIFSTFSTTVYAEDEHNHNDEVVTYSDSTTRGTPTSSNSNVQYLSDMNTTVLGTTRVYLSDITSKIVSKSVAYGEFYLDKNEPGQLISLLIDGKKTYYLKGLFAHAPSEVIYDISEYIDKGINTFSAYLGVDTYAGSNGNGVKFFIYGSNNKDDKNSWHQLTSTNVLKGNSNAEKVTINIEGYKYLILKADNNGNDAKDHAVYADAMIYNSSSYIPPTTVDYDWIETVASYDTKLLNKSSDDIINDDETRLTLLQRTLVSRINYDILQAWLNADNINHEAFEWLFKDADRLEEYLLGGSPTGSYTKALDVLAQIYNQHKEDFKNSPYKATLQKLMFAVSLTHSAAVESWFSGYNGAKTSSTGLGRYEAIKQLYLGAINEENWEQKTNNGTLVPYHFEWEQFDDLTVEEMRWVTDNKLSDEEFLWLNWYVTVTQMGETQYSSANMNDRSAMNPYTYIYYGDGGNIGKEEYYVENPKCGYGNEFYDSSKRTEDAYEKYHLKDWESLQTHNRSKPTLWIAFEEDGVCGTLMHVGQNLEKVFGIPSSGLGQPGHGAYIYANRQLDSTTGKYTTVNWTTYNWVSNWDQSEKGERMLLDWGTRNSKTVFNNTYNLIYIPLAQKAVNDYSHYSLAELYIMMADVQTNNENKISYYNKALEEIPYHIKAWYQLLTLKVNNGAKANELYELGETMMEAVGNAPMAIEELSNIIEKSLGSMIDSYRLSRNNILDRLTRATEALYMNASGVQAVARSLLNRSEYQPIAIFSFDDNILRLTAEYADKFEYSLDYNNYDVSNKANVEWIQVEGKTVDLSESVANGKVNAESDIAIHLVGDAATKVFIIDITKASTPTGLYANDLENRVINSTLNMEWKIEDSNDAWTRFTSDTVFKGQNAILVRNRATGTTMASDAVKLTFTLDPAMDETKVYIPISGLKATASSYQPGGEPSKAIDGNPSTIWHNLWNGTDTARWIQIEVTDGPVEISKIDYLPRSDAGNGTYTKVKIETSLDGKDYQEIAIVDWARNNTMKSYVFETPVEAKYVRLTGLTTYNNFASAAMINLYKNTVPHNVSVEDLSVSYMTNGWVYNGQYKTPLLTVRYKDKELILNEDYRVEYVNNLNAGTAKIILTGLGIYDGTKELEFEISKAPQPDVMPELEMVATIDQDVLSSIELPTGWSWKEPNKSLTAGKTIEAIAEYKGQDKDNYELNEVIIRITQDLGNRPVISGPETPLVFDIKDKENIHDLDYLLSLVTFSDIEDDKDGKKLKVDIKYDWEGELDWEKEATHHIYFTVTDSDENSSEYTLEFTIINTTIPPVELNNEFKIVIYGEFRYTGQKIIPDVSVYDKDGHELKEGTDYHLIIENNINAGTAIVRIIANNDLYTGEISTLFEIKKALEPAIKPDLNILVSSDTTSLSDINLPEGWRWENENIELVDGENILRLVYAGDENHEPSILEIVVVKEKTPEDEHNWDTEFTIDTPATCTKEGLKSIHCKDCSATKDETVIQATGHVDTDNDGKCDNCGESMSSGSDSNADACKYCGKVHTGFFGRFVKVFHTILAFFKNLFK